MAEKTGKDCPICCSEVPKTTLKASPKSCPIEHPESERACSECWEAYLSKAVEDKDPADIECMFCPNRFRPEDVKKLCVKRPRTWERYQGKRCGKDGFRCQARCAASRLDPDDETTLCKVQPYDREMDGRVFTCKYCNFRTCTDCDLPEHEDESCLEYQAKLASDVSRAKGEAASSAELANLSRCPACATPYVLNKGGCQYTWCGGCKHRFCSGCHAPWVGDGGHYLLGKDAHAARCHNHERLVPTTHGYLNRWQEDELVAAMLKSKKTKPEKRTEEQKAVMVETRKVKKEMREQKKRGASAALGPGGPAERKAKRPKLAEKS